MITVKQLKAELDKFSEDSTVYAYEGESVGLVICAASTKSFKQIGFIHCDDTEDQQFSSEIPLSP